MTKLSTLSLAILASSLSFAASYEGGSDSMTFTMGAEVSGGVVDVSWGTVSTVLAANADTESASNVNALLNISRIAYTEGNDKNLPLAFGGNVYFKTHIADSVKLMARFGLNTALKDANTLLITHDASFKATDPLKSKMSYEAAGFIGYEGVALGVAYDMREYEMTATPAAHTIGTVNTGSFKENTVLFLARAESSYDAGDFTLNFGVEAANSFGRASDSEADTHYKNLASQFQMDDNATAGITASSVHTYINKLSVFVGADLYSG